MSLRDVDQITIEVTAADIAGGRPNDSEECPIALALHRAYPRVRNLAVGYPSVSLGQYEWKMDARGAEFVRLFDAQVLVGPRKVTLVKEG